MKVMCKANTGDVLPKMYFDRGYSTSSRFDLIVEKEYVIYGISLWRGFLLYLIVGEGGRPHWTPAELFEISDHHLPSTWYFSFFGFKDEVNAIWGYDELVNNWEYYDQLSNQEPRALEVFTSRKLEIDHVS